MLTLLFIIIDLFIIYVKNSIIQESNLKSRISEFFFNFCKFFIFFPLFFGKKRWKTLFKLDSSNFEWVFGDCWLLKIWLFFENQSWSEFQESGDTVYKNSTPWEYNSSQSSNTNNDISHYKFDYLITEFSK